MSVPSELIAPAIQDSEKRNTVEVLLTSKPAVAEDEPTIPSATEETSDLNVVDFDGPDDPINPQNWNWWRKWMIVFLVATMSTVNTMATTTPVPAAPQMLQDFHSRNGVYYTMVISIWELGEGIGPFLIGPLSEHFGRLPIWHFANLCYVVFAIACALSTNISMLVAFRFLNGLSVAIITLGPAIIGDVFKQEQRGLAMSLATLPPLLGPTIGPIVGSFLSQARGWRWTFWIIAIGTGGFEILSFLFFKETYAIRILHTKVQRLRDKTGNANLQSKYDKASGKRQLSVRSILKPIEIWLKNPIVFMIALYDAMAYGYYTMVFRTLTIILRNEYNFSQGTVGIPFIGMGLGTIVGALGCGATSDWYVRRRSKGGEKIPEYRLLPMVIGGVVLPIGLFLYGWTAEKRVAWIAPIIGTAILAFGAVVIFIAAQTYIVDAFPVYSASALAACNVLLCAGGAFLPLAGPALYNNLGPGWGSSVLGFISLAFVPVPLLLMRYGERLKETHNAGVTSREGGVTG